MHEHNNDNLGPLLTEKWKSVDGVRFGDPSVLFGFPKLHGCHHQDNQDQCNYLSQLRLSYRISQSLDALKMIRQDGFTPNYPCIKDDTPDQELRVQTLLPGLVRGKAMSSICSSPTSVLDKVYNFPLSHRLDAGTPLTLEGPRRSRCR